MNEVKLLQPFTNEVPRLYELLALTDTEAYLANYQDFIHAWEVGMPSFVGIGKDRNARLMCWGNYSDTNSRTYTIVISGDNAFSWSDGTNSGTGIISYNGVYSLSYGINVSFFANSGYFVNDTWAFTVGLSNYTPSTQYQRWASVTDHEGVYFISPSATLRYCNGSTVWCLGDSQNNVLPFGRYIETFYDHLVIGCPSVGGTARNNWLLWSDLRNYSNFDTQKYNEASYYETNSDTDFLELSFGVTGVKKMGNRLIVYTSTRIFAVDYVGLPLVMRKTCLLEGIGNVFPYALAGYDNIHFFISDENFYEFRGGEPTTIGDDIKEYFFNDLSVQDKLRYRVWAWIDRYYNEVHWVYCSKAQDLAGTEVFDKELVYNIREKTWWVKQNDNVWSHTEVRLSKAKTTIGDLVGEIGNLDGPISALSGTPDTFGVRLFGKEDRGIYREEVAGDEDQLILKQPYLVSQDMIYTDVKEIVTIGDMTIHADYDTNYCSGLNVYVSARVQIDDPILWQPLGVWTKDDKYGLFKAGVKVTGRVFRWKFEPLAVDPTKGFGFVRFTSWAESVDGLVEEIEK